MSGGGILFLHRAHVVNPLQLTQTGALQPVPVCCFGNGVFPFLEHWRNRAGLSPASIISTLQGYTAEHKMTNRHSRVFVCLFGVRCTESVQVLSIQTDALCKILLTDQTNKLLSVIGFFFVLLLFTLLTDFLIISQTLSITTPLLSKDIHLIYHVVQSESNKSGAWSTCFMFHVS